MLRIKTRAVVCYLGASLAGFVFVAFVTYFWPKALPFGFFEFWTLKGSLWSALHESWWLFLLGLVLNGFTLFTKRDGYKQSPGEILAAGFGISVWAGVMEEVCFRWILFLNGILILPALDWIGYLIIHMHIVQDIYLVLCPIANFFTLGYLEPYLMNGHGWEVAAALMSSNGRFRNGHFYQGLRGATLSWFCGMYFFYLMFAYGLIAAILVHFLFDLLAFSLVCLDAKFEKLYPLRAQA